MYSIFKNTVLKKLKFVLAGFLLITILPGNAGVKDDGRFIVQTPENIQSGNTDKISDKVSETLTDTINHYMQNTREISATGKSFNLLLNIH
jgi:hypothetical protein